MGRSGRWALVLLVPSLMFVVYPMAMLFVASVTDAETGGFTLRHLQRVLTTPRYVTKAWNTLSIALGTTVSSVVLGVPLSLYLWRRDFLAKRLLVGLLVIPYMTPHYILALAILFLLGQNGALAFAMRALLGDPGWKLPFDVVFTYHGILLVFAFHNLALVVFLLLALLSGIDRQYEEAARSLGASPFTAIRRVILPMTGPAVAGATALVFSRAMVDYVVIAAFGGHEYATLAVEVANRFFGYLTFEVASALAVVLSLMTMTLMYGYLYWFRWRRPA